MAQNSIIGSPSRPERGRTAAMKTVILTLASQTNPTASAEKENV
jgi:hypothetical protein